MRRERLLVADLKMQYRKMADERASLQMNNDPPLYLRRHKEKEEEP